MNTSIRLYVVIILAFFFSLNSFTQSDSRIFFANKNFQFVNDDRALVSNNENVINWWKADGTWEKVQSVTIEQNLSSDKKILIKLSPNGQYLAVVGNRGIVLLDPETGKTLSYRPKGLGEAPTTICFPSDNELLVFSDVLTRIEISDVTNELGEPVDTRLPRHGFLTSSNGRWMVSLDRVGMKAIDLTVHDLTLASSSGKQYTYEGVGRLLGINNDGTRVLFQHKQTKAPERTIIKSFILQNNTIEEVLIIPGRKQRSPLGNSTFLVDLIVHPSYAPKYFFGHHPDHFYFISSDLCFLNINTKELITFPSEARSGPFALSESEEYLLLQSQIIDLENKALIGRPSLNSSVIRNISFRSNGALFFQSSDWMNSLEFQTLQISSRSIKDIAPNINLSPAKLLLTDWEEQEQLLATYFNQLHFFDHNLRPVRQTVLTKGSHIKSVKTHPNGRQLLLYGDFEEKSPAVLEQFRQKATTGAELSAGYSNEIFNRMENKDSIMSEVIGNFQKFITENISDPKRKYLLDSVIHSLPQSPFMRGDVQGMVDQEMGRQQTRRKIIIYEPEKESIDLELPIWYSSYIPVERSVVERIGVKQQTVQRRVGEKRSQPKAILDDFNIASFLITPDGKYLYTVIKPESPSFMSDGHAGEVVKWQLNSSDIQQVASIYNFGEQIIGNLQIAPSGTAISMIGNNGELLVWSVATNELLKEFKANSTSFRDLLWHPDGDRILALTTSGDMYLYSYPEFEQLAHQQGFSTTVRTQKRKIVAISPLGDLVLTFENGISKLWNTHDLTEIVSINSLDRLGGYIAYSPDGYYMSSRGLDELSLARKDDKLLYSFEQYDLLFNRPDKVLENFRNIDQSEITFYRNLYWKRLERRGLSRDFNVDMLQTAPIVNLDTKGIPISSSSENLSFEVSVGANDIPVDRLNILVNGVPLYGKNGIPMNISGTETESHRVRLKLGSGKNVITIFATAANGVESFHQKFNCTYTGPSQEPNLFLITIGVSEYEGLQNLPYAVKDAQAITNLLADQKHRYREVNKLELLNDKFDRASLRQIKNFLRKSLPNDRIIIYYAGHGLRYNNTFHLATSSSNIENADLSISFEAIENLFTEVEGRQRLIIIDACNSGEYDLSGEQSALEQNAIQGIVVPRGDGEGVVYSQQELERMKQLFVDLRTSSGANIIASARGDRKAYESETFGHGIFTHFLLQTLQEQPNQTVEELNANLIDKLKQFNPLLEPTMRAETLNNDWIVY